MGAAIPVVCRPFPNLTALLEVSRAHFRAVRAGPFPITGGDVIHSATFGPNASVTVIPNMHLTGGFLPGIGFFLARRTKPRAGSLSLYPTRESINGLLAEGGRSDAEGSGSFRCIKHLQDDKKKSIRIITKAGSWIYITRTTSEIGLRGRAAGVSAGYPSATAAIISPASPSHALNSSYA